MMTLTTRAAIKAEHGAPLLVEEIELNDPNENEVLVELFATGLCHSQLHQIHNPLSPMPLLLGHEGTGTVLKAGSAVTHVKEGDRVMIQFVPRDLPEGKTTADRTTFRWRGEDHDAGVYTWAEHALLNEQMVIPLANDVPTDVTAIIGCAVITGAGAALYTAEVQPGQSVAVFGVGGVGTNVIAGAKIAGADPIIAVDLQEGKLGYAKEIGATHTVNAAELDAPERIKELTDGGVDFAFDAIGVEAAVQQAIQSVKAGVLGVHRGGTAVIVGIGQGDVTLPRLFPQGERSLIGSMGGSARPEHVMPKYVDWYKDGQLPLDKFISKRYSNLDEINEGVRALENGEIEGRSIIVYKES
ncbi:MAG: alcohol dehydrogenase [Chloroflexi bacterium]|nr:alcohol dehydrogenase [Chloroflexota bacterium]|tara:strand:- start:3318 stop:4385 length:1068 start_codon:yes stop_codon:yes gene_type:complete